MDTIQIKNLKTISDSGPISIKPITVFVGQNSCGKSSLIRCFPLFKQSSESKILGTILWSGKYVDYGSFDESINYNTTKTNNKEISFSFSFKLSSPGNRGFLADATPVKITINVSGDEYSKSSYTDIIYEIYDNKFSMRITSDIKITSAFINGTDFTKQITDYYRAYKIYNMVPILFSSSTRGISAYDPIFLPLSKEIKEHVHHRTSDEKIRIIARNLRFGDSQQIIKMLSNKALVGNYAAEKISQWGDNNRHLKKITDQIILCNLEKIIDQVSDNLRAYFLSTRYITPLRAAADRYYRIQNTSIEELDPNGSNLAMFLHAKKETEIDEINEWLNKEIGFSIKIISSHGHASIFISDKDNPNKTNIADTGFGISQILPVLIQVWQLSKQKPRRINSIITPTTIIIEQPELHLHPKMQSRVGDVFCKAIKMAKDNGIDLRIIIETHSKDIIESIGKSIECKTLNKEDASIYIVTKNDEVNISESKFDDYGFLEQWPYGFFDGA